LPLARRIHPTAYYDDLGQRTSIDLEADYL
jgi:hypothetical protein